jgi:hypothetical protein
MEYVLPDADPVEEPALPVLALVVDDPLLAELLHAVAANATPIATAPMPFTKRIS